jgi:hypothetical protein
VDVLSTRSLIVAVQLECVTDGTDQEVNGEGGCRGGKVEKIDYFIVSHIYVFIKEIVIYSLILKYLLLYRLVQIYVFSFLIF